MLTLESLRATLLRQQPNELDSRNGEELLQALQEQGLEEDLLTLLQEGGVTEETIPQFLYDMRKNCKRNTCLMRRTVRTCGVFAIHASTTSGPLTALRLNGNVSWRSWRNTFALSKNPSPPNIGTRRRTSSDATTPGCEELSPLNGGPVPLESKNRRRARNQKLIVLAVAHQLSSELALAIGKSVPPVGVDVAHMKLPFESCVLMLPKGTLVHPTDGDVGFIAYSRLEAKTRRISLLNSCPYFSFRQGMNVLIACMGQPTLLHWDLPLQ